MIRYLVNEIELGRKIRKLKPTWFRRARVRSQKIKVKRFYEEKTTIWNEIKSIFIDLQCKKCAYCERELGGNNGKAEYDVDHFRPKCSVRVWPDPEAKRSPALNYDFSTGAKADAGYYLLAYKIRNYAACCKICNTKCKLDYFPVAGDRVLETKLNSRIKKEKPYLIFPIGSWGDDPEDLITFKGLIPVPYSSDPNDENYKRARVTIDLFDLAMRDDLIIGRARVIETLWELHDRLRDSGTRENNRRRILNKIASSTSDRSPHANCARSFHTLCESDFNQATEYAKFAGNILDTEEELKDMLIAHIQDTIPDDPTLK